MVKRLGWKRLTVAVVAAGVFASVAGYGYAALTTTNNNYTGCLKAGQISSVAIGGSPLFACVKPAVQISWSQTGPQGPPGTNGVSVTSASEPAGANCTYGGSAFTAADGTTYACNGAPGTNGTNGITSTYIKRWDPTGSDLGSDGELTSGESVTTTLSCDSVKDQITGAGVQGAAWTDGTNSGILPTSAVPLKGDGSTTADHALLRVTNDGTAGTGFNHPAWGWIVCAVGS